MSQDDRKRIELEDVYDPEPDNELIAVARDVRREDPWSRELPGQRCRDCRAFHDHPVCPRCGLRARLARSRVEMRWLRNHGIEPTADELDRFTEEEKEV